MFHAVFIFLIALLVAACATAPHESPELAPPRAVEITPIHSDRPVVALVLGAGGARGFAHVGVIKVLEAEGIRPTTPRTRTLDFSARLESITAGETAARAALPEIRARIAQAELANRRRGLTAALH